MLVASPASRLLQGLTAGSAKEVALAVSAADFMPYIPPFPTQPFRATNTPSTECRITIPAEYPAAPPFAHDLHETLNVSLAQSHTVINMYGASAPTLERARSSKADQIFRFLWHYVEQFSSDTTPAPATASPPPPWEDALRSHLQQTAYALAEHGVDRMDVERNFKALLADVRSDSWWLCLTRGIGRDAIPFAVGSVAASLLSTFVGAGPCAPLLAKLATHLASGAIIMFTNTAGAALFDTVFPSLRDKLPQTMPAPGLEHLNASIHSPLREFVVSCLSFAGCYGAVRNPLRLFIEKRLPAHVLDGRWKDIVHASLEVPLTFVGAPLRYCLDHLRTPESHAAIEILLQDNLADLLSEGAAADAQGGSWFSAFYERFSKNFCSMPTAILCTLLVGAFAGIEWRDAVVANARTVDWQRTLLNLVDYSCLYAAIGGLLQIAQSDSRVRDILTAYLRRGTDRLRQMFGVEQGEVSVTQDSSKSNRTRIESGDSGYQCFQSELQNAARQDGLSSVFVVESSPSARQRYR
ncbi:hypothetical protein ACPWR0_02865 [Pandoraea pneumonica]|uniref:hypothetical protein n=1 Tax=Pandoraea pneumonica TaxID=2508299 RepID=UPI003CE97410